MPNSTTNYGLLQPLVNNSTDADLWGGYLNTTIADLDGLMLTAMSWTPSVQTSTITVTAPTTGTTTTGSARLLYLCNATGGAFAANLPAASTCSGVWVAFKKTDASANAITVTPNGSDKIDGAASFVIGSQYTWITIVSDGTNWDVVSQTAPAVSIATSSSTGIVQPDNTTITVNGSGVITATTQVPIFTALGVGSIILAYSTANTTYAAGTAVSHTNLVAIGFSQNNGTAFHPTGDTLAGNWQPLTALVGSGSSTVSYNIGLWQRIS